MHTARWILLVSAATLIATAPVAAQVGGTITDAGATYTQAPGPASEGNQSPTGVAFRPETTPAASQMFQNWWYYRVAGDTREYPFGNYARSAGGTIASTSNVYSGNTATVAWTDTNASSVVRFTASYVSTLTHTGTNAAILNQSFQISNPGASALSITLFNYADLDANGTNANDTVAAGNGSTSGITDTDGSVRLVHSVTGSVAANAFQVAQWPSIINFLSDASVNNLDGSGVPFFGDESGAFQWNLTVPAGGSITVNSAISVAPVPEPGTLLLTGLVVTGAAAWRRRRRA
jgi:hypothetical protein